LRHSRRSSGPAGSNNVLILINRVLNWAVDEGMIEFNPGARLRKAGERKPRERVLTADEMCKLWRALAAMELMNGEHMAKGKPGRMLTPATRSVLRLLLLTGQRRVEVAEAAKAELDLTQSEPVWTIPGVRTKNGLLHRVPLTPMAAIEFDRALSASPKSSDFVFPTPAAAENVPILASTVTRAMSRVTAELAIKGASPHDLRRTVGTELARLGVDVHVRKLILNHAPRSRDVTETVYNRYAYDKEKREALTQWEQRLAEIVSRPASRPSEAQA
jgi:integrase